MTRQKREKSESGIYHVMIRGIDQVQLFYDDEDRKAFMWRLERYKSECDFSLFAWCLMGNHVHLLIKEHDTALSIIMKRISLSYSHYYNTRYDRRGYLFQDRYKSKPIDSDEYLLAVVRYIHRNPLEIGQQMTSWTSYRDYLTHSSLADTALVLGMLAANPKKAQAAFKEFVGAENDSSFDYLGTKEHRPSSDTEAIKMIQEISGLSNCWELSTLDKYTRSRAIAALRANGLSVRQIARLTGVSRGIIAAARNMTSGK